MIKKIGLIERCDECPFFIDSEWEDGKMTDFECKKLRLKGRDKQYLFDACPLPDYNEVTYDSVDEAIYDWEDEMEKSDDGFWSWIN